jgi:hypothetical protein
MEIEQKRNRSFIGLALNTNRQISHVQLCQFRSDLGFTQMVNLTVYILHHFMQSGLLGNHVLLIPLVKLALAIGIDVRIITADEAYHDNEGDLFKEIGTYLVTPPKSKVLPPEYVDIATMQVTCDDMCPIPMEYVSFFFPIRTSTKQKNTSPINFSTVFYSKDLYDLMTIIDFIYNSIFTYS